MFSNNCIFLFIIMNIVSPIFGYKILMICPLISKSHHNLCRGVIDPLVDRGHEVTFISAFKSENSKFTDISVPELRLNVQNFQMYNMSIIEKIKFYSAANTLLYETLFSNVQFKNFLENNSEKFDVVIYEHIANDMLSGFGVKYNCPVILLSPISLMQGLSILSNNPLSLATVPHVMISYTGNMNLWQRTYNVISTFSIEIIERILFRPKQISWYEKYFPEESKKVSFDELSTLISGILVNSHPSMGISRALLPNTIEIGGYHIKEPEPLPKDLKKILDEAQHGAIYFSMGSNLKSSEISPELRNILLKAFGNIKQTVLWKYEEDIPDKPKNLVIRKWMPQTAILAHPNIKLFISHCGMLSHTEAVHFGVPVLAIPIFGDQFYNSLMLEDRGNGLKLEFSNITDISFQWALTEVLGNTKYVKMAKEIHRNFHERPIKPRDLLAFHVESIIKLKGAKHLSPVPLSLHSILLLDVIAVILIPLLVFDILFIYILYKFCCRNKKETKNLNNKQKIQ